MLVSIFKRIGAMLSLNDPRWGRQPKDDHKAQESKKPGEGPPDLDQLWRDFNQRLNRLFGQKNGGDSGGGGGDYRPDIKGAGVIAGIAFGVVALMWLASGFYSVEEGKTGVVSTFGKVSYITKAGLNWRWPSPFQSHEIVGDSGQRVVEIGYRGSVRSKQPREALMLTDDENIIDIQFAIQYTLNNPVAWVVNNRERDEMLRQVAETAIREVVGKSKMDFVLYEGREKIASDVRLLMQHILDRYGSKEYPGSGAQIKNVTIQGVQPPEQVQGAFDDAVKAGQDRERQKNEGQAYANDVIPKARGTAFRLLEEAEAYRSMVTENATGNASRFQQVLTEYQKAPAVTRDRMYLETMQQIYTSASKVLVDAKSGSNLLYLPLDKLIAQAASTDASKAAPPAAPVVTIPTEPVQTMETVRPRESRNRETSRDRESR